MSHSVFQSVLNIFLNFIIIINYIQQEVLEAWVLPFLLILLMRNLVISLEYITYKTYTAFPLTSFTVEHVIDPHRSADPQVILFEVPLLLHYIS